MGLLLMRGTLVSDVHSAPADPEQFMEFAERHGWGDGLPLVPEPGRRE